MYKKIGYFLSKEVLYEHLESIDAYKNIDLSHAVILLYFNEKKAFSRVKSDLFLRKVINDNPLSIVISGENTEENFDALLRLQSLSQHHDHIMTYSEKPSECLDMLFLSAWPAQERHDNWQNYMILEIGDSGLEGAARNYLLKNSR